MTFAPMTKLFVEAGGAIAMGVWHARGGGPPGQQESFL